MRPRKICSIKNKRQKEKKDAISTSERLKKKLEAKKKLEEESQLEQVDSGITNLGTDNKIEEVTDETTDSKCRI